MSVRAYDLYKQVKLVPDISDEQIEEMLAIMQPVVLVLDEEPKGLYVVDVTDVDRRRTAYTWDPKKVRRARLAWSNGFDATIPSFHTFGAPSFFKPSLAETLASIRRFLPDGWRRVKFFWLDSEGADHRNVIGMYHWMPLRLFESEFSASAFRVGGS